MRLLDFCVASPTGFVRGVIGYVISFNLVSLKTRIEEDGSEQMETTSFRKTGVTDGQWHTILLHFVVKK